MGVSRALTIGLVLLVATSVNARAQLRLRTHATGLTLPVAVVQDPADRNVKFIVQQNGRIRVLRGTRVLSADFLDLSSSIVSGGEQGLLGLAFPPDAASSGRFFVNFTDRAGDTVVARFRRSSDPLVANASSRFDLRFGGATAPAVIDQPFSNHNGGHLAFGPDGYLYIGLGDGGSANDPQHRAQNLNELLGKMLRIDVNVPDTHPTGYRIPADNPFLSGPIAARQEIWAVGLRNPWRYSFDDVSLGGTGALIIGDVGQVSFEEVDYEPRGKGGRNYGWRNREGAHDNVTSQPPAYLPLTDPIHEYNRSVGQSITGGYIYRGKALPERYRGRYFFADYIAGRVFSIGIVLNEAGEAAAVDPQEHTAELGGTSQLGNISSFGVDGEGELFLVSYSLGRVFKLIGPPAAPASPTGASIIR